jgi:hypothetical protein
MITSELFLQTESESTSSFGYTYRRDYSVYSGPGAICSVDIDADSDIDIITANKNDNTITISFNNDNGIFNKTMKYNVSGNPMGLFVLDVGEDQNNDPDIIVCGINSDYITILYNNGTGGYNNSVDYALNAGSDPGPVDVYADDIDNDGDPDIAVCNHWAYTVTIFKNSGNGIFTKSKDIGVGTRPYSVFLAQIDNDLYLDLVTVNYIGSSVSLFINDGTGNFKKREELSVDSGAHDVWVTDIDADGDNDIITANQFTNNVTVLKNFRNETFNPMVTYQVGQNPISVFLGNADNDSYPDIFTANVKSNSVSVLYNDGNGTFGGLVNWSVGTSPYDIAIADFNLDGLDDIAAANFGADTISILMNNFIPTIEIYEPNGVGDRADTSYKIKWKGTDHDINDILTVDLYFIDYLLVNNVTLELKIPIILGTNNDGIYTWDTTKIAEGSYAIHGVINDDRGGKGYNYSIGNVTIYHNCPPEITVLTPSKNGAEADTSFLIKWKDKDNDDDAVINLYYDEDQIYKNDNHKLIIEGISEDNEDDFFNWMTEDLPVGEYYILAEIYDKGSEKCYNYSSGRLTIDHNILNNAPPEITIIEPDGVDDRVDGSCFITWWDFDPDDNAIISLYYDVDNHDFDGSLIIENLSEDLSLDEFHWTTFSLPNGSYYVYGKIDDGKNPPVFNYSSGPVEIIHISKNIPPRINIEEPDGLDDIADEVYEIQWTDSDPDDDAEIELYFNNKKLTTNGTLIVTGLREDNENNSYAWDTSEIIDGDYFIYAKINDFKNDPYFNISIGQVQINHSEPVGKDNDRPILEIIEPDGLDDLANNSYTIQWIDEDIDDDAVIVLFYDTDNTGLDGTYIVDKLSEDGELDRYVWNTTEIPEGDYYIYGVIYDYQNVPYYNYSRGNLTIDHHGDWDNTGWPDDNEVKAVISSPVEGTRYLTTDSINFDGSQSVGENLTFLWRSSIEGHLGTHPIFSTKLSEGKHVIILEIFDNEGRSSISDVIIIVESSSSKDQDHIPTMLAIIIFISILIISFIIFLIMIRKNIEKRGSVKVKATRKKITKKTRKVERRKNKK